MIITDHQPRPDAVKRAVPYFDDPRVAGVTGRPLPVNALSSPSAYHSTVESLVHQMITMRAKDRLRPGSHRVDGRGFARRSCFSKT
ncbi:MAG: hypothetical protein HY782_06055 [Chloroflexi bacterium]|nr:hypothetical protein [Chloroflexota bacterium]